MAILDNMVKENIMQTTERTISNSFSGGMKLIRIEGASEQGANPTPDNPQEIKSVGEGGSLTIKTEGKQVLNILKNTAKTRGGVTISTDENCLFTVAGTSTTSGGRTELTFTEQFELKKGNYFTSIQVVSGNKNGLDACLTLSDGSSKVINGGQFTIEEDTVAQFGFNTNLDVTYSGSFYITVTRELEFTNYIPYQSKEITIPLSEPLRSIGSIKDEIVNRGGVWGVLRRIGNVKLDGSEEWNEPSVQQAEGLKRFDTEKRSISNIITSGYPSIIKCTLAEAAKNSNLIGVWFNAENGYFAFRILYYSDVIGSTTEEFKAFLANNPCDVNYAYSAPIFEEFEDQTPFSRFESFDIATHILTNSAVEPTITFDVGINRSGAEMLTNYIAIEEAKKDISEHETEINNLQFRMDELAFVDWGEHDLTFTNGVAYPLVASFESRPPKYKKLRSVIVNGYATGDTFIASIPDAELDNICPIIQCVSNPTLNGTARVSLVYVFVVAD